MSDGCGDPNCKDPNCEYGKYDDAAYAEITTLRAHLAIAKKALEEIDDLPSVQQDEGPTIARAALKDLP